MKAVAVLVALAAVCFVATDAVSMDFLKRLLDAENALEKRQGTTPPPPSYPQATGPGGPPHATGSYYQYYRRNGPSNTREGRQWGSGGWYGNISSEFSETDKRWWPRSERRRGISSMSPDKREGRQVASGSGGGGSGSYGSGPPHATGSYYPYDRRSGPNNTREGRQVASGSGGGGSGSYGLAERRRGFTTMSPDKREGRQFEGCEDYGYDRGGCEADPYCQWIDDQLEPNCIPSDGRKREAKRMLDNSITKLLRMLKG